METTRFPWIRVSILPKADAGNADEEAVAADGGPPPPCPAGVDVPRRGTGTRRARDAVNVVDLLRAGALYFALVFGAGFVLGPIRILWLVPHIGERTAELLEAPIMLGVIILSARWVSRRFVTPSRLLAVGCVALALGLLCESTVVLWLRGLTIREYIASRDPVAGAVFIVMLGLFAVMPLLVAGPT